ncbi:renal glandular kallikrein-like [Spodoptera frugiperda]|uniref:Renal glandular kallikrein-like n=1 Tax=Spodoptera frugiperda TaxID=7108 RepID=A0A9R0EUV8_SPOFR|nr:renal glandular kallikrein-like [Spodoptera frugiperda]
MRCITGSILIATLVLHVYGRDPALRIIGGTDPGDEDLQYVARLRHLMVLDVENQHIEEDENLCTCAILTSNWTLTAAHCLIDFTEELINVLEYKHSRTPYMISAKHMVSYGPFENDKQDVIRFFKHPAYARSALKLSNDIALVNTLPIHLKLYGHLGAVDYKTVVGHEAIVAGYGSEYIPGLVSKFNGCSPAIPLKKLKVVVAKCGENRHMNPSMCVARRCKQPSYLCIGDSGGPLIHPSGIIGITSKGPKDLQGSCKLKSSSPVFDVGIMTPVSPYIDWISRIIETKEIPEIEPKKSRDESLQRKLARFEIKSSTETEESEIDDLI